MTDSDVLDAVQKARRVYASAITHANRAHKRAAIANFSFFGSTATGAAVNVMTQTQGFDPISIRLARKKCEALAIAEEGRHEDCLTALAEWNAASESKGEKPDTCHAYDVASKALDASGATVALRIDSANAAVDLYYAVCSGTFQIDNFKAATRIADALRDRVRSIDPGMVQRWQAPYGP